jgi:hypothetical protein
VPVNEHVLDTGNEGLMKRRLKSIGLALITAVLLAFSGGIWYGISAPVVHRLPLAQGLVDVSSAQGTEMLLRASTKADYEQLAPAFVAQSRRGFCGVASSVAVINAALHPEPPLTQQTLFTPAAAAVRGPVAVSFHGLTLKQLAGIIQAHGLRAEVVHAAHSDADAFRSIARGALDDPSVFIVVNYDRASLGQRGDGHISPIAAYDAETDRVLILDVAAHKYPYTWVPISKLWMAMDTTDPSSRQSRGYLLVSKFED